MSYYRSIVPILTRRRHGGLTPGLMPGTLLWGVGNGLLWGANNYITWG